MKETTKATAPSSTSDALRSGYVLIPRAYLANMTSLAHERWKRAHPEFCCKMGIG